MKKFIPVIILFLIFFVREIIVSKEKSITCDETVHIPAGYFYVKNGDFFINFEHPPFSKTLSGIFLLPQKIFFPENLYKQLRNDEWDFGKAFFYFNREKVDNIVFYARFPMILLGILLGFFIYLWSKELYGLIAGIFSLFLFSFCPNFLGHSCLVTTDVPFTTFFILFLYFLSKFFQKDDKKHLIFSGIFFGLSIGTKFTGIVIIPFIILILLILEIQGSFKNKLKLLLPLFLLCFILIPFIILLLTYRIYGFGNFLLGLRQIIFETTERGHRSFLNGKFSNYGWRYYFIFAFLYKTPVPFIILFIISILIHRKIEKNEIYLIIPAIIYFIFSSWSKKQIGIRYILPFYALIYIYCGRLIFYQEKIKIINQNFKKIVFYLLIAWYIFSSIKIHPHYLAYFNEIAGGPDNGWKHLIDSNIDWGQDLKEFKKYLQKEGNPEIMLNYFGSIFPETYGIIYEPAFFPLVLYLPEQYYHLNSLSPLKEYLVISVNCLQGLMYEDINIFDWLKEIKPKAKIGYSMFVYDITKDTYIRKKLLEMFEKYGFERQAERQRKIIERIEN
ncbi:MAG: glycosyltransferase family 39 protein [Candidatus Omnitrophica bacterium]|nr:glycosyltransferase family 39 protein [Candidatus Omnitrophota bacterium]MCM8802473.1 glycosyltransferase family 39 protein [Candidatus Omnitrophota bacterium]